MLAIGTKAPDFTLEDHAGNAVSLKGFVGKKVVLYFYPKDDTPGCTKEACGFRDVYGEITTKGAVVIGVSADSVESHEGFRNKYALPFILASDRDKKTIEAYGAWGEKVSFGKTVTGILRTTYVIDEKGYIAKVFENVKPDEHAKEILDAL